MIVIKTTRFNYLGFAADKQCTHLHQIYFNLCLGKVFLGVPVTKQNFGGGLPPFVTAWYIQLFKQQLFFFYALHTCCNSNSLKFILYIN